ncbi:MAG: hypothetical protein Q7R47_02355 [Candidatus Diapherotrites archaeon]|nr:hypothetical protein [Candidatus Diapherotrites archaeon]
MVFNHGKLRLYYFIGLVGLIIFVGGMFLFQMDALLSGLFHQKIHCDLIGDSVSTTCYNVDYRILGQEPINQNASALFSIIMFGVPFLLTVAFFAFALIVRKKKTKSS